MMDLHVRLRGVFFTEEGWPVVSPQRYTGSKSRKFSDIDLLRMGSVTGARNHCMNADWKPDRFFWGESELEE